MGDRLADFIDGFRHPVVGATVNDDFRAFGGKRGGDGETDAGGGSGDEGEFLIEMIVHAVAFL